MIKKFNKKIFLVVTIVVVFVSVLPVSIFASDTVIIKNTAKTSSNTGGQSSTGGEGGQSGIPGKDGGVGLSGAKGADGQDGKDGENIVNGESHSSSYIETNINGYQAIQMHEATATSNEIINIIESETLFPSDTLDLSEADSSLNAGIATTITDNSVSGLQHALLSIRLTLLKYVSLLF